MRQIIIQVPSIWTHICLTHPSCVVNNGNVEESITSTGSYVIIRSPVLMYSTDRSIPKSIIASSSTAFTTASVHSDKKVDRRVVAGATVGGLAIVIAALLAIIILRRRTRRRHNSEELSIDAFAEITPHVSLHSDNRAKGGGESVTNEALTGIREHVGVGERDITEPDLEASNLSPTPVIAVNDDFIRMSTNSEASELVALRRRVYILEAERRLLPPPSYVSMNDS